MDDFRTRLETWGWRYEYRLADILRRFDAHEAEKREKERQARQANILSKEGNEEVL